MSKKQKSSNDSFKIFLLDYCSEEPEASDQQDDNFYELRDWVFSDFKDGIPSSSVQREIDKQIQPWMNTQKKNAERFLEFLFDMSPAELAFPSALALCRYLASFAKLNEEVEPEFKGKEIEAFVLIERVLKKGYEPGMNDTFFELSEVIDEAISVNRISMLPAAMRMGAWNATYVLLASVQRYYKKELKHLENSRDFLGTVGYCGWQVCGNETSWDIIKNTLPEFNFEDLLRWEYFPS
jgi:hypothetical protein